MLKAGKLSFSLRHESILLSDSESRMLGKFGLLDGGHARWLCTVTTKHESPVSLT